MWQVNLDICCLDRTIYSRNVLGCQVTDSIPPQVSRKESLRPIYTDSEPVCRGSKPGLRPNDLLPTVFGGPSHLLSSITGEQKVITQTNILSPSWPVGCQLSNAKRQAEKRKVFTSVFGVARTGIEPCPPSPRADAGTTRLLRETRTQITRNVACEQMYQRSYFFGFTKKS